MTSYEIEKRKSEIAQEIDRDGITLPEVEALEAEARALNAQLAEMRAAAAERRKVQNEVIENGKVIRTFDFEGAAAAENRKDYKTMEFRDFLTAVVENRAAGTVATMANVIPTSVLSKYVVGKAPSAFMSAASITNIENAGSLKLPIMALQTVSQHTENDPISGDAIIPGSVTINHGEYCFKTGYSALTMKTGAESLQQMISDTLFASMMKKFDGLCYDAVAGLTYGSTNSVTKAGTAPTFSELVSLCGLLGADYLENAAFFMNPQTYFAWLLNLKDDNNRPILDAALPVDQIALAGYRINLDSNIPTNVIYFGDARRVHMNVAQQVEVKAWTDYDTNTEKFAVRSVAGAACETGAFVKLS